MKKKRTVIIISAFAVIMLISAVFFFGSRSVPTGIVVLDPGHGGNDAGAVSGERREKDDNLAFALCLKEKLEKNGVKVLLTREDDSFVSLEERCKFANKNRAELFVSLHRNSAASGSGAEIWVSSRADAGEIRLAEDILAALDEVGISRNRGVKKGYAEGRGDYYVNSKTEMTSCLVELGFMDSASDNRLFDKYLDDYAEAAAKAITQNLSA